MDEKSLKAALDAVAARDADIARALATHGYPAPRTAPGGFEALLSIIANQQISKQAAAAILDRLFDAMGGRDAGAFLALPEEALRQAGLSRPKIRYARGIAEAIREGRVTPDRFPSMPDEEVIAALTALSGIGLWSAEIYCMFSLGRPDLFPGEDIALQEAIRRLRGLEHRPSAREAREIARDWSPWRSAVAVFLWHYYRGAPV